MKAGILTICAVLTALLVLSQIELNKTRQELAKVSYRLTLCENWSKQLEKVNYKLHVKLEEVESEE